VGLWLNTLHPTRVEMLTAGPTQREQQLVGAHFAYWQALVSKGIALLVGRTQDAGAQTVGIALFEAPDEAGARALAQADPTVSGGVMTSTVQPYRIGLLAEPEAWSRHGPRSA
jgi:uncharacterized protein YciI